MPKGREMSEDIDKPDLIRMSPEGFAAFLATCSEPSVPVPEMVEVIRRPAPWEEGQRLRREEEPRD
jgi:uncharacterized protein (DUF1778 family)